MHVDVPGDALLRLLRGEPASSAWLGPGVLDAAKHHRVVILLAAAVQAAGLEGEQARRIRATAMGRSLIARRMSRAAGDISGLLHGAGIDHSVLKGPVVAAAYPNGEREFTDLDVLVHPSRMRDALVLFGDHGILPVHGDGTWPPADGFGEIELAIPGAGSLDLHADLIHFAAVRAAYRLSTEQLLGRRRPVQLQVGQVPALDATDTLLHVALHATISGADRLGWFADLAALTRQGGFSWADLVQRAQTTRTALPVGIALERARHFAGALVPLPVLSELLAPGACWAALLRRLERRRPIAHNRGRLLQGRVVVMATRPTGAASARALAEAAWQDVLVEVVRNPNHPWRTRKLVRNR